MKISWTLLTAVLVLSALAEELPDIKAAQLPVEIKIRNKKNEFKQKNGRTENDKKTVKKYNFPLAEKRQVIRKADVEKIKEEDKRLNLKYVAWDVHMLGVDSPEKIAAVTTSIKRTPTIALVSYSGINGDVLKGNIEYVYGPKKNRGMHDTFQISEVMQIASALGIPVKIKVYLAANPAQIAEAFKLAGKDADIVITYYSYWSAIQPMLDAVAENPDTLYISPYVEVRDNRTNTCFQGGARHPDGSGLRNFITSIPLCRHAPAGSLLIPSCRDENDIETVNFVAPSSYASSKGETCPSAGVTAVTAAYIIAASENKPDAEKIIEIMLCNTSFPEKQMLPLKDFSMEAVTLLQDSLNRLKTPDANGIRRLEADGVLNIWNIYQDIAGKK